MDIYLTKADIKDCENIHKMQIIAFNELLEKYHDFDTNPGSETIERIEEKMKYSLTDYYFICMDKNKIGVIRVVKITPSICKIAPMFIMPEYQGKGYAQEAICEVEKLYPSANQWVLDTIKQEEKLCYLYEKMGYSFTGKTEKISDNMTIVFYEKLMK